MSDLLYRSGDSGPAVRRIAGLLARVGLLEQVGDVFDEALDRAVRTFQQERGLWVDGVVGPRTWGVLAEAGWDLGDRVLTHLPGRLMAGDDVFALQRRLSELGFNLGRIDGIFGPDTERAVREFQRNTGEPVDGTCGPATFASLRRLRPIVSGGSPTALRAAERIRADGPLLTGKVVVLDPADDAEDLARLDEVQRAQARRVLHDLVARVEGRLVAHGVQAYLTRLRPRTAEQAARSHQPDRADRADRAGFANRTGAHLSLSVGVDASPNPDATGVGTYFFGSQTHEVWSSSGERLAGLVQREVVARTGMVDLRTHAKTYDFLRRTRMPAVRTDVGYLSNAHDAQRLADPAYRDRVAEALVVAVQRFYLAPEDDAATGVLRLDELRAALGRSSGA